MHITIQMSLDAQYAERQRASGILRALAAAYSSDGNEAETPAPVVVEATAVAPAVVVPMGEALPPADAPGAKGRARKRKEAEPTPPTVEAKAREIGQLELAAAPVPTPPPLPNSLAAATETMTIEEFRTTMRDFLARGLPLAKFQALVESYGARSAAEIPTTEWPAVLEKAKGMLPV